MKQKSSSPIVRYFPLLAIVSGAVFGWLLFRFGSYSLLGSVSKTLAVLIGSAWVGLIAFATKISDITESPSLTPDEHKRLEAKCKTAVRRIWALAACNAVAVWVALVPSALVDGHSPVYEWLVVLAGVAAGFSVYSIVLNARWQEELRAFRSDLRLRERERARQAEKKALFIPGNKASNPSPTDSIAENNRVFDWPKTPPSAPH